MNASFRSSGRVKMQTLLSYDAEFPGSSKSPTEEAVGEALYICSTNIRVSVDNVARWWWFSSPLDLSATN